MNNWTNFFALITIQLIFFIFLVYKKRKTKLFGKHLLMYGCMGLFFGIVFDLVFGWYLSVYGYYLGFGPLFLSINGILSFGIMIATVTLLNEDTFFKFYTYVVGLGFVYELINYFFPVWSWHFGGSFMEQELILLFAGYFGLAFLMAGVLYFVTHTKFKCLSFF